MADLSYRKNWVHTYDVGYYRIGRYKVYHFVIPRVLIKTMPALLY